MGAHTIGIASSASARSMFDIAFEVAAIGMALVDPDGRLLAVNSAFARMLGYDQAEITDVDFRAITHPEDIDADEAQFRRVLAGEIDTYSMEKRYYRKDRSIAYGVLSVATMRDGDGKAQLFVSQIVDISERKLAEHALAQANAKLSLAMGMMDCGIWQYDIATRRFTPSQHFIELVGGHQATAQNYFKLASLVDASDRRAASLRPLLSGAVDRSVTEYRIRIHDGSVRWFRCHRQMLLDDNGRPEQVIGSVIDITEERAQVVHLEKKASTDALTGLLNRRGMKRYVKTIPAADLSTVGIIMLDLDHFKQANDAYGHAAGDAILVEAAGRLRQLVRNNDAVVRLGGDEFAVILRNTDGADARRAVDRVLRAMMETYGYRGQIIRIGASAGLAIGSERDHSVGDIVTRADAALYLAKQQGRNTWRWAA
ncbi:diguanylate cyclase [Novosphingobium sp. SG751A]|uniref:diguanylate cyclase n=1 Tax=Novosphingobium sp. SG751A TaxID=2587000 RepID=UPI001554394C|nr:diguanylate cyclase [Novosphingobium sp. SG751A]